jgi:hypothetical protein
MPRRHERRLRAGVRLVAWCAGLACLASLGACSSRPPDPRFATPQKTVRTLLGAYGLDGLSQQEIQRRLRARQQFRLTDPQTFKASFVEMNGDEAEAYAGFVVGALAAGRDDIRVTIIDDTASVFPTPQVRIVMQRTDEGWKIDLPQSVPPEIRAQFQDIARRARKRH